MLIHTSKTLEWEKIKERLKQLSFSPLGKKEIDKLKFLRQISEITQKLSQTLEMKELVEESPFPSTEITSIQKELDRCKIENSYLDPNELITVAKTLKGSREVRQHILRFKDQYPLLSEIAVNIETFKYFEDKIFKAIDNNYELTDQASPELKAIRRETRSKKSSIEKRLRTVLRSRDNIHFIQDDIITVRENRYVIPIKRDHKGKIKGIVLDTSNSGETLFTEPENVVEDNNQLIALFRQEKDEIIKILKRFTQEIRKQLPYIITTLDKLSEVDLIYAKGRLANEMNAIAPEVNEDGIFKLFNASHPLLKEKIVPINLFLGDDYNILIITGPNTGGKTVALKTLGLLTMMASAGLLIPVQENSIISTVDMLFIDSGDEQSIEQNLSTFSAHIKRIIQILRHATEKSLVLIDELGSGTDPEEGTSLGLAILDELREIGCKTIVTTHYAKLKSYFFSHEQVENASCEFDLETLKPTYKLVYGVSGKSNAIEIAKKLGLKQSIIDKANSLIEQDTTNEDRLYDSVYKEQEKIAQLSESYQNRLNKVSIKESELRLREEILKKEHKELKRKQINEDRQHISETRKKILKLYNESKLTKNNSESIKKALDEINITGQEITKELNEMNTVVPYIDSDHEWQVDEKAYMMSLNKTGKICFISKSSVTLQLGDLKIKTELSDLKIPTNPKTDTIKASSSYIGSSTTPPVELMLIGMRGEKAVRETEMYIESLYTSSRDKGRIVHGKGSGILRSLIEEMLKKHPHVRSFNLAVPQEGGYGVTEVFIK